MASGARKAQGYTVHSHSGNNLQWSNEKALSDQITRPPGERSPFHSSLSPVQWRSNYQIQSMSISWQALCHSTWLSLEKSKRFWSFSYHFELDCLFDLGSNEKALSDQIIRPTGERSPFHSSPSPVHWCSNYQIQSMSISWQALCHRTWLSLEKVQ